ncbi:MAG: hypothetical protein LBI18_04220, partial [Planctomycetaceae bacterium]|nr:hypothetical protein [Planctomycetaceae bacterium]
MKEQCEAMLERTWSKHTFWKHLAVYVLIIWTDFLTMHGYYLLLDVWNTPHPSYQPLFSFIAIQVIALLFAIIFGVWQVFRGQERLKTAAWLLLALLPAFIWYSQVSLAFQFVEERQIRQREANWYLLTSQTIGAALFDGIGRWTLPFRLEGDRVIMFYDASIADPKSDMEKMDAFIKKEEQYLGATMPTKIHWMRAPLLGMPGLALNWVSIAQTNQYDNKKSIDGLDYHEASHNIMSIPSATATCTGFYPPTILLEGWAQARSTSWETLAEECWELKQSHRALTLHEAISDIYYNSSDGRIYQQGGTFVTVLLDKFGQEKFRELYLHCTRKTFERDIERIYGATLDELDKLYWREVEVWHGSKYSFEKATEHCSVEEKSLLDEFRQAYERQMKAFYQWTKNGTLEAVVQSSYLGSDADMVSTSEILFQAKDGVFLRFCKKSTGSGTHLLDKKTGEQKSTNYEVIDCNLVTSEKWVSMFQYSSAEEESKQESWDFMIFPSEREYKQEYFRRHYLAAFCPLSLFFTRYGHSFTNPVKYLWEPAIGTIIQSVIEKDGIVELTLKTPE